MSTEQTRMCLACGQATTNPKFCSRSCAAKYNNRKSPKRSPEGTCKSCGATISSSRTYCDSCRQKQQDSAKPAVIVSEETVFEVMRPGQGELGPSDTIDQLISVLEEVTEISPRYLPNQDWRRHRQFLRLFGEFRCRDYRFWKEERLIQVANAPIAELPRLLVRWVESFVRSLDAHPLSATFALDTAEMLLSHVTGAYMHSDAQSGRLNRIVDGLPDDFGYRVASSKLKREITQRDVGGLNVVARIPDDATIARHAGTIGKAGDPLRFEISRCHLSESSTDQCWATVTATEDDFDLSSPFTFFGSVFAVADESLRNPVRGWWECDLQVVDSTDHDPDRLCLVPMYLPIRWITHTVAYKGRGEQLAALPVTWQNSLEERHESGESEDIGDDAMDHVIPLASLDHT